MRNRIHIAGIIVLMLLSFAASGQHIRHNQLRELTNEKSDSVMFLLPDGMFGYSLASWIEYTDTTDLIATKYDLDTLTVSGGTSDNLWSSDENNKILYNEYPNYRLILHNDINYTGGAAPDGSVQLNGSSSSIFLNGTDTDAGRITFTDDANLGYSQIGRYDGDNFITREIAGDIIYQVDKDGHTMSQSSTLKQFLKLDPQTTTPTPELGKIYLRESDSTLQFYDGTAWREIQLN